MIQIVNIEEKVALKTNCIYNWDWGYKKKKERKQMFGKLTPHAM